MCPTVGVIMRTIRRSLWAVLVIAAVAGYAAAQQGRIDGELYGEDGEPVAGARLMLDEIGGTGHYEFESDERGDFIHLSVSQGRYQMTIEIGGRPFAIAEVRVSAGDNPLRVYLERLEIESEEFSGDLGVATRVVRDVTLVAEGAAVSIPSDNPFDDAEDRAALAAADAAMREAFDAGRQAMDAEDFDEAIRRFTAAAEGSPTPQHIIYANLALAYEQARQLEAAAENFELAQETALAQGVPPEEANYYTNLTLIYATVGDVDRAIENAEKAVEFDSEGAGLSFYNIGVVLTNAGQATAATTAFERAVEVDPGMADAHYQLGIAYLSMPDRMSDAAAAMERYLELRPDGPDAETARQLLEFARQ